MAGIYTSWERLVGKYPDVAKDYQSEIVNSYWMPGAEGEVSAAVAVRYSLPLPAPSDALADLATDLIYYKMMWRQEGMAALKTYIDERLQGIVNGTVTLVASGGVSLGGGQVASSVASYASSFGMDDFGNFRVDSGWQQDSQTARGDWSV